MRKLTIALVCVVIILFVTSLAPRAAAAQTCDPEPPDGYTQQASGIVEGDELIVTVSSRFAGAVESLTWRGKEFINIFDHGRQISYAWQMDGHGECLNPTEPGSASDLFSLSSTSELLEVCRPAENIVTTRTQPAYWLAPGETGFCDGGVTTAVNDALVSDHILDKTIEIGYGGIDNVISFSIDITIPNDHSFLQLEIPTGYLTFEFTNYWLFDPLTGELVKPEDQPLREPWSYVHDTTFPPILTTEDGEYAMGAYSAEDIAGYSILRYQVDNPDDTTNKWNIVLQESPAPAGVYSYQSFAIVGTLEQVREAMVALYELHPKDVSPPVGYVDLMSCDLIAGWAWDPKTPNEPIEVEFFAVGEDGAETSLGRISADVFREDLVSALGDNGAHGYSVQAEDILPDGKPYQIRVYGINSNPSLPAQALLPVNHEIECSELNPTNTPIPTATEEVPTTAPPQAPTEEVVEIEPIDTESAEEESRGLPCVNGAIPLLFGIPIWVGRRKRSGKIE